MKKSPLATFALAAVVASLVAAEPETPPASAYFSFLGDANRAQLLTTGELLSVPGAAPAALRNASVGELVRTTLPVLEPTLSAEGWFVFPRPAGVTTLALYNAMNAVGSMEGLEYYSVSRKRREPLILASYRVAAVGQSTRVADPVFTTVPDVQRAVIFQKDNRVGDGQSEVVWRAHPDGALSLTLTNVDPIRLAFVTLVDPGKLQMLFVVRPLADKVAVYGLLQARTLSLFGLEKSKEESYRNRMRALADWLGQRIAALR